MPIPRRRNGKLIRTQSGKIAICGSPCDRWVNPPANNPTFSMIVTPWIDMSDCYEITVEQDECYEYPDPLSPQFAFLTDYPEEGSCTWQWSGDGGNAYQNVVIEVAYRPSLGGWHARIVHSDPYEGWQPAYTGYYTGGTDFIAVPDATLEISGGKISGSLELGYEYEDGSPCGRGNEPCAAVADDEYHSFGGYTEDFSFALDQGSCDAGSLSIKIGNDEHYVTDDGNGNLADDWEMIDTEQPHTVNYATGAIEFHMLEGSGAGAASITADYTYPETWEQFAYTVAVTIDQE